jgi:hypothetical protein
MTHHLDSKWRAISRAYEHLKLYNILTLRNRELLEESIASLLWNPKIYFNIHNGTPLVHILSQMYPPQAVRSTYFLITYNIPVRQSLFPRDFERIFPLPRTSYRSQ